MGNDSLTIFQRPLWVVVFALTAAIAWGWAYPLIKLGFGEFAITADMTGSKMVFAGLRFTISGMIILAIARAAHRRFAVAGGSGWLYVVAFAIVNTTLHYAFFYFGLSHSPGARAAILNSMSVFLLVILACMFFESDRLTSKKLLGCCVGIAGVVVLNFSNADSTDGFSFSGDGMIILNALCSAFAGLMTRGLSRRVDIFVGTGYSLAIGGVLLVVAGYVAGGTFGQVTATGIVILLLLIAISTVGFALYNKLLSCNPIGKVAIFNSLIPVVGAVTSCICLGETFYMKYVVAATLATAGIYIINRAKS